MSSLMDATGSLTREQLLQYETAGFVVLRDVFSVHEMEELRREADRLLVDHRDLISPANLRCRYMPHYETGEKLFEVFDPVNDLSPLCARFTADRRIVGAVEALYGEPASLFKEKLIFKPAGAMGYQLHQDIPQCWNGFPKSFLTVLIPIDPSSEANGCTEVYSGYHHSYLSDDPHAYMFSDDIVDESRKTSLVLNPGDIAIFHGLTPHRSDPNRSEQMRRVLYVSYNALSEGGDQRAKHYAEFQEKLRCYFAKTATEPLYFR